MKGTYYRWSRTTDAAVLIADILGADVVIAALPIEGVVTAEIPSRSMDPDTARMIGVRLIEAAALADDGRSVREP